MLPEQEALDPQTSSDRLRELAADYPRLVAVNLATPPDLLVALSHQKDREVRRCLTRHPRIPTALMMKLGIEFPEELWANPSLRTLLLKNPILCTQMPHRTLTSLLRLRQIPVEFLKVCSTHRDLRVRLAVADHRLTPRETLEKLVSLGHQDLAEITARMHIRWAGQHIDFDQAFQISVQALYWHKPAMEELIALDAIPKSLISCLAERLLTVSALPPHLLDRLANDHNADIRQSVASHKSTSHKTLEVLTSDSSEAVRREVATNLNTPVSALACLLHDPQVSVQIALANNPNTPNWLLEKLVVEASLPLQRALARNRKLSPSALSQLAESRDAQVRARVAWNPNTSESTQEKLAKDRDLYVRCAVARNPATPRNLIAILARDKKVQALVHFPSLKLPPIAKPPSRSVKPQAFIDQASLDLVAEASTPETLESLLDHPSASVRLAAAENPETSELLLAKLANDKAFTVRQAVARHPNCSAETLRQLAQDASWNVRRIAAQHPVGLSALLTHYITSAGPSLHRLIALFHLATPSEALVRASRSWLWLERYIVAQHPNTPKAIRQRLSQDVNIWVRGAVAPHQILSTDR